MFREAQKTLVQVMVNSKMMENMVSSICLGVLHRPGGVILTRGRAPWLCPADMMLCQVGVRARTRCTAAAG